MTFHDSEWYSPVLPKAMLRNLKIILIPLFRLHTDIEFSIFLLFHAFFFVNMCLFTIKENNVDSSTLLSLHHLDLFYDEQLVCSRGLLINWHTVVTCSLPCLNGIFYRLNWKLELFFFKVFILGDSDENLISEALNLSNFNLLIVYHHLGVLIHVNTLPLFIRFVKVWRIVTKFDIKRNINLLDLMFILFISYMKESDWKGRNSLIDVNITSIC